MQRFKYIVKVYKYEEWPFSGGITTRYNYMCNCGYSEYVHDTLVPVQERAERHLAIHNGTKTSMGLSPMPMYLDKHSHELIATYE